VSDTRTVGCGACGTIIDEPTDTPAEERQPCPKCGSTRRTFNLGLASAITAMSSISATRFSAFSAPKKRTSSALSLANEGHEGIACKCRAGRPFGRTRRVEWLFRCRECRECRESLQTRNGTPTKGRDAKTGGERTSSAPRGAARPSASTALLPRPRRREAHAASGTSRVDGRPSYSDAGRAPRAPSQRLGELPHRPLRSTPRPGAVALTVDIEADVGADQRRGLLRRAAAELPGGADAGQQGLGARERGLRFGGSR
jgi:hypothetical protein